MTYVNVLAGSSIPSGLYRLEGGVLSYRDTAINLSEELVSTQLISSVDQLNRTYGGTAAAGILGFALLGPLGAVGGMLVGGRKKHVQSTVFMGTLNDGRVFLVDGSPSTFAEVAALASTSNHNPKLIERLGSKSHQISLAPPPLSNQSDKVMRGQPLKKLKSGEKRCPSCAGAVKIAAKKCKHCKLEI
jgi:hypothetical protein